MTPPFHLKGGLDPLSWLAWADWLEENPDYRIKREAWTMEQVEQECRQWRLCAELAPAILRWCRESKVRNYQVKRTPIHAVRGEGWKLTLLAKWAKESLMLRMLREGKKLLLSAGELSGGPVSMTLVAPPGDLLTIETEDFRLNRGHARFCVFPQSRTEQEWKEDQRYMRRRLFALAEAWQETLDKLGQPKKGTT